MKKIVLVLLLIFLSVALVACDFFDGLGPIDFGFNGEQGQSESKDSEQNNNQQQNQQQQDPPSTKNYFQVTFDSNGGSVINAITVEEFTKVAKPSDPTRQGYKFEGWYNGSIEWDFDKYVVSEDTNLVANWAPRQYVLSYYNGDEFIKKQTVTYGTEVTIYDDSMPSNSTFEFNETIYTNGDTVVWLFDSNMTVNFVQKSGIGIFIYDTNFEYGTITIRGLVNPNTTNVYIDNTYSINGQQCTVTEIDYKAFIGYNQLEVITLPDTLKYIDEAAFEGCTNLRSINIPDSVESIGYKAFYGCVNVKSLTIGAGLTQIGGIAFGECNALESISISPNNPVFDSRNNCNAVIVTANNSLIYGCKNTVIPGSVVTIDTCAFSTYNEISNLEIPIGVKNIGVKAFYGLDKIKNLELPSGLETIGSGAFSDWLSLETITIPNSIKHIDNYAFSGCPRLQAVIYYGTEAEWNAIKPIEIGDNIEIRYSSNKGRVIDLLATDVVSINNDLNIRRELSVCKEGGGSWDWISLTVEANVYDYTKLVVNIIGPEGETLILKPYDQHDIIITTTGEGQELVFVFNLEEDGIRPSIVIFPNSGVDGTGHPFIISKLELQADNKPTIDLLTGELETSSDCCEAIRDVIISKPTSVTDVWDAFCIYYNMDFSGFDGVEYLIKGTEGDSFIIKPNDQGTYEKILTLNGEWQHGFIRVDEYDSSKACVVLFPDSGQVGTGHEVKIRELKYVEKRENNDTQPVGIRVGGYVNTDLTYNQQTGLFEGMFTLNYIWVYVTFNKVFSDGYYIPMTINDTTINGSGIASNETGSNFENALYIESGGAETGKFVYGVMGTTTYNVSYDPQTNVLTVNIYSPDFNPAIIGAKIDGSVNLSLKYNEQKSVFEGQFTLNQIWSNVRFVTQFSDGTESVMRFSNTTFTGTGIIGYESSAPWDKRLYSEGDSVNSGVFFYSITDTTTYNVSYNPKINELTVDICSLD